MNDFKVGEYILYSNGDRHEIGKIKRLCDDGAFVWYNSGETAAKTPYDLMHKIVSSYCITKDCFGGNPVVTNSDLVREMTDEELVGFIFNPCPPKWNEKCQHSSCHYCLREWLKQEVEE